MAFSSPLRALASRNYRLYFGGQVISLIGTWMTQTTSLWLIYQISIRRRFFWEWLASSARHPRSCLAPSRGLG